MTQMPVSINAQALHVFQLVTREEDGGDPARTGAHMPVGAIPIALIPRDGGVGVVVMCTLNQGALVWHPMVVAVEEKIVEPMLGKALGKPIGLMPIHGLCAALLPELPWPTHVEKAN